MFCYVVCGHRVHTKRRLGIDRLELKRTYDTLGLETIPIPFGQKFPPPIGYQKTNPNFFWENTTRDFNIGLRLGKVCDLDTDDLVSQSIVKQRLENLGIYNAPICRSQRGQHHFVRIIDVPEEIKYTHWNNDVGKGEARIRDCYSVIPNSEVDGFEYFWKNNWYTYFQNIPVIKWSDISDMVQKTTIPGQTDTTIHLPRHIQLDVEKWVYDTLETLKNSPKGKLIEGHKTWPSRSEAEAAVIARLDTCGYSLERIKKTFENYKPGHFMELKDYGYTYIQNVYNNLQNEGHRPSILNLYLGVVGDNYKHKINRILLSICHQFNKTSCYLSFEQMFELMNLTPGPKGTKSKMGLSKAVKSLQNDSKLRIIKGISKPGQRTGIANTYSFEHLIDNN